jgi:hypothetical protein
MLRNNRRVRWLSANRVAERHDTAKNQADQGMGVGEVFVEIIEKKPGQKGLPEKKHQETALRRVKSWRSVISYPEAGSQNGNPG